MPNSLSSMIYSDTQIDFQRFRLQQGEKNSNEDRELPLRNENLKDIFYSDSMLFCFTDFLSVNIKLLLPNNINDLNTRT